MATMEALSGPRQSPPSSPPLPASLPWSWRHYESFRPLSARLVETQAGERLVQVCSTQYLGTPWHPVVAERIQQVVQAAPAGYWGSLGSQYLGGSHEERLACQAQVAAAAGKESGVAFVSGWAANYAVGEALGKLCDVIVSDRRNH